MAMYGAVRTERQAREKRIFQGSFLKGWMRAVAHLFLSLALSVLPCAHARQFFVASPRQANTLSRADIVALCEVLHTDRVFTCGERWEHGAAGQSFDGVRDLRSALQVTADSLGPDQLRGVKWIVLDDIPVDLPEIGKKAFRIPKPFLGFFSFQEDVTLFAEAGREDEARAGRRLQVSGFIPPSHTGRTHGRGLLASGASSPRRNSLVVQHAAPASLSALSTFAGGCTTQCRSEGSYFYSSTGQDVVVYIVDGVVKEHVQFKDVSTGGTRLLRERFLSESARMSDPECAGDHATHVAGIAAGYEFGSSKSPTVVSVAVQPGCAQSGLASDLVEGLDWVLKRQKSLGKDQPPAVVSMSLILTAGSEVGDLVREKVEELVRENVVVVSAAGNFHEDACDFVPANMPEVITVAGASVFAGANRAIPWSWSNFGKCVDVFAPAVDIESASPDCYECTALYSGTSQSTPYVTGLVAQYLSVHRGATPDEVKRYVLGASTDQLLEKFRYPYETTPRLFAQSLVDLRVRQVRHSGG